MASKWSALTRREDSLGVFCQRPFCSAKKVVEEGSFCERSTEPGSTGGVPPKGEATVISALMAWKTSQGWANSGCSYLAFTCPVCWSCSLIA